MAFRRDLQPELMDDPSLSRAEHQLALAGLSRLNQLSGVVGGMYRQIARLAAHSDRDPIKLLDIASGSGDLPTAWAVRAKRNGLNLKVTTTDISPFAVEQQQQTARDAGVTIDSIQADCFANKLPSGFDLITCSLFMHHLTESQTTTLLKNMATAAEQAIVVCDLDRSRLNYALIYFASRVLTRSHIVHKDALLSVKNAYTRNEFKQLASATLGRSVKVKAMHPCRFLLVHPTSGVSR